MRKANISDIKYILPILENHYGSDLMYGMEYHLSLKIRDTFNNDIYLNDKNNIVLFIERLGNFKCQIHIYTLVKARGREVKTFFISVINDAITNIGYTTFMTFVPCDNLAADFAARFVGFKKIVDIEDAGGIDTTESLYLLTKKVFIERFK